MSFLDQLKKYNKSHLKPVTTKVTNLDGKILLESKTSEGNCVITSLGLSSVGYVVDVKPDYEVACVIQKCSKNGQLSFGSQDVALSAKVIADHSITHLLSLIPFENLPSEIRGRVCHKQCPILDLPEVNIKNYLDQCFDFINSGLQNQGHVYVHCNAGVSRSTTVIIAFLMKFMCMSYTDAKALVHQVRPVAKPNDGFVKQLKEFDEELKGIRANVLRKKTEV